MTSLVARIIKRLIILLLGAVVVYLIINQVFPFFDHRTPLALALFATYLVGAYILIPLAFRAFRFAYHPVHLPLYCTTPDGFASDPVNIALVGNRQQVILAMEAAGWQRADPKTPVTVLHQMICIALHQSYPNAPVSTLYLFGRRHDLAFQKEVDGKRAHRHHVRFWVADTTLAEKPDPHVQFWHRFHLPNKHASPVGFWVGAASKDVGLAFVRHNAQVTHMIDPNTMNERTLITADLEEAGRVASSRTVPVHHPFSLRNRAVRGRLNSDGYMTICELQ